MFDNVRCGFSVIRDIDGELMATEGILLATATVAAAAGDIRGKQAN